MTPAPDPDPVRSTTGAPDVEAIVALLLECAALDLTVDPAAHHDMLDHGLQTAAGLRVTHPDDVELQVAGLVHDIGHLLPPHDAALHGVLAADFVRPVLGDCVAELVRLHVPAKRYLVTVEPDYRAQLNGGSTTSLTAQGDRMAPDEVEAFEAEPEHRASVALRRADEAAKVHGLVVDDLPTWRPLLDALAASA